VTVKLYTSKDGGETVHEETLDVSPKAGSFTAYLGTNKELDLAIFQNNPELWMEFTVGEGDQKETLKPRMRIGTTPFAAEAGHAVNASDADKLNGVTADELEPRGAGEGIRVNDGNHAIDPAQTQRRVSDKCSDPNQFAVGMKQNGKIVCKSIDPAEFQQRVSGQCSNDNEFAVGMKQNGDIICKAIDTTKVTEQVLGAVGSCSNGYMTAIDPGGTVTCGTAGVAGDITAVSADDGLTGGSSSGKAIVGIAQKGVKASMLDSGAVTDPKIATDAVGSSNIKAANVSASELASGSVGSDELKRDAVKSKHIAFTAIQSSDLSNDVVTDKKLDQDAVGSSHIKNDSIRGKDLKYGCDKHHLLIPDADDGDTSVPGCPLENENRAFYLPFCKDAPVGSTCRYDEGSNPCSFDSVGGSYSNPANVDNCSRSMDVFIKGRIY
ncbi:MAG: hypothetical protein ABEN55_19940, partial [Bradymonadaceae bacterium]